MADSSRYVLTNQNNSALIPNAQPSDYPLLISTNGQNTLSQLLPQYLSGGDDYQTFYAAQNMPIASTLQVMFSQTQSVGTVGGLDLETTFDITFAADGSLNYNIEWLDADGGNFATFSGTAANLAALVSFINTNIPTVTASVDDLVLSIEPDEETPNQLVRISFSNLALDQYEFTASGVPAVVSAVIAALISSEANEQFLNFYCIIAENNLFYSSLAAGNATKIAAQQALAQAIEATQNAGDSRKVCAFSTSDPNVIVADSTTDIMYLLKQLTLKRSRVDYYAGNNMTSGEISAKFGTTDGNSDNAFTTVTGVSAPYLTESQINVIYDLDNQGNLSSTCKNGNYYTNSANRNFYYPGITPSGLPFDITVLADHIARDCRYAQLQNLVDAANEGLDVPYNQQGINQQVGVIRSVLNQYLANGYITPVDAQGNSCVINAPTFAQIQANPALTNQFANRVLTGITVSFIPAGGINKVIELFTAVI